MGRKRKASVAGVVVALGIFALQQTVLKDNHGSQQGKTNYANSSVKVNQSVDYGSPESWKINRTIVNYNNKI